MFVPLSAMTSGVWASIWRRSRTTLSPWGAVGLISVRKI